jgi:hypothetical protein
MDIHNHWLRQEIQNQTIIAQCTPSNRMTADGLTQALAKDVLNDSNDKSALLTYQID